MPYMTNIDELKTTFKNHNLFDLALTHRSWVNEHKGVRSSNERLEFLGDAILEFVVSREIYIKFPDREEGFLTALRANLVNTVALAEIATSLNLGKFIYLSKGEEDGGGRENTSLLADTVEAIIGAIFIDRGIEASEKFIKENILINVNEKASTSLKDPKSLLQEYVQSLGRSTPKYKVVSQVGPDHNKRFEIEVEIENETWGRGGGKSKAEAEQEAARQALAKNVK